MPLHFWRWSPKSMIKLPSLIALKFYELEVRDDDERNMTIRSNFKIYMDLESNSVRRLRDFHNSISKIWTHDPSSSNCFYFRSRGGHFRRQL